MAILSYSFPVLLEHVFSLIGANLLLAFMFDVFDVFDITALMWKVYLLMSYYLALNLGRFRLPLDQ